MDEIDEYLDHEFEGYSKLLELKENLRKQVQLGQERLDEAIENAASIPRPSNFVRKTEKERRDELRKVLEKREQKRIEEERGDVFHVRLFETPTIFLFGLETECFVEGTEEGEKMKQFAETYKMKNDSVVKPKKREAFNIISPIHVYDEMLQTDVIEKKDVECSASIWELFDEYNKPKFEDEKAKNKENRSTKDNVRNKDEIFGEESISSFKLAAMFTCRVLSSNNFEKEQIEITKKHQPCRSISYKLSLLWTLAGTGLGRVNKLCWNTSNSKIIAIGYGDREGPGTIKVWHNKNPEAAERTVTTNRAVTCLQFSKTQPRLLAATTRDGCVLLVDITNHNPVVTLVNEKEKNPYPDSLWGLAWTPQEEDAPEKLLTVGDTGLLWIWDPIRKTESKQVAKLCFITSPDMEMHVRFQQNADFPPDSDDDEDADPTKKYFMEVPYIGLSITSRRSDEALITTDVGCIIRVQTNRENGEWEKLPGHRFAVLGLRYSPFIDYMFLTYSGEAHVSIWVDDCTEPLLKLQVSDLDVQSIDCAEWSPSHSSVLAYCSKEKVCVWDISRSVIKPVAELTGKVYTNLCFSEEGTSLIIGCEDGDVLVYRLSEMPHRPHLQIDHLEKAMRNALKNKPGLLKKLEVAIKTYNNI